MVTTTQGKAVDAYSAINRLRQKVKGKDALEMFHLKNALQESYDFQVEQEKLLVEQNDGTVTESGSIMIRDADKRKEFLTALNELRDTERTVDIEPIPLMIDRFPDITLDEIEQLNDFIIFK